MTPGRAGRTVQTSQKTASRLVREKVTGARSAQRTIPITAVAILHEIPDLFQDDGCSGALDAWLGFDFRWACRIHDWRYCSRARRPEFMGQLQRHAADEELRENVRVSLPWRWRWLGWVYFLAVKRHGGDDAYDSCGPEVGAACRHGLPCRTGGKRR